jgi:hypothetical protein
MIESTIQVGGGMAMWVLSEWSDRKPLLAGLTAMGLEKYCPEPRTPPAALKDALSEIFPLATQLVRPLKDKTGFTVVEESRGNHTNDYHTLVTAKIDQNLQIEVSPYDAGLTAKIAGLYNTHLGLLRSMNVGAALVKLLANLHGTTLRPGGGVYWLPETAIAEWKELTEVIEPAGHGKPNSLYLLRTLMDADAVRTVGDAISGEVMREAARIQREIESGDLGERALESRKEEAQDLAEKVRVYESILHINLNRCSETAESALNSATVAALVLSTSGALVESA